MLPILVQPSELEACLDDDRIIVIDLCRDDIYSQYHLPGAIHVAPQEIIAGTQPAVGKLPAPAKLESLLSRIGYSPDKHYVVYDDEGGGWAGRFIWTLDVIGHKGSSYLDGGLIAWAAEGRPMTAAVPVIEPVDVSVQIDRSVIVSKEDILAHLDDPDTVIWDARSPEEHAGVKVVAARGGHIPGAINLDWLELMDRERNLRLREDLAEYVGRRGFNAEQHIITHCQTHHRSGLTYLAGKILGFDIRAYDGSWSEWGNDPSTPVE